MTGTDDYDRDDWDDPYNYSCDSVGMGGDCGPECPVYNRGDCNIEDEIDDIAIECAMKKAIGDDVVYEAVQYRRLHGSFDSAMEMFGKKK